MNFVIECPNLNLTYSISKFLNLFPTFLARCAVLQRIQNNLEIIYGNIFTSA